MLKALNAAVFIPAEKEQLFITAILTVHASGAATKTETGYKMSRPNVQKILYKNVQLVCLS